MNMLFAPSSCIIHHHHQEFELIPAPAPRLRGIYESEHPLIWIMPVIGLFVGLFSNIAPISAGLVLMPLFQEVTHNEFSILSHIQL
jgi:hypothetical protein